MSKQVRKKKTDDKRVKLLIKEGEGLMVEFKEKYTSKIDEDIVAFAYTKSGVILLGVRDDRTIAGEQLTNEMNGFFRAVFFRPKKEDIFPIVQKVEAEEKLGEKLGENERKILEMVLKNKYISAKELSENIGISETALEKNIGKLKKRGLLRRIGADRGGYWEVVGG